MPSFSSTLPPVESSEDLAELLGLSEFALKKFCLRMPDFYHTFERKKKNGTGQRQLCAPAKELKQVQRNIKRKILDKVELHQSCTGYRRGMSIVSNAKIHVGQRFVLNLDIQDFFQSISTGRVAGLFFSFGYSEKISLLLAKLCCFRNALPQGAPTSPPLANLICHKLDRRLSGLARTKCLKYSRYCDDITISGTRTISPHLIELLRSILKAEGFTANEDKTRLLTQRSCQIVTGLTVNEKVNIPRKKRHLIRAILHGSKDHGTSDASRNYLAGLSSYMNMVKSNLRRKKRRSKSHRMETCSQVLTEQGQDSEALASQSEIAFCQKSKAEAETQKA